MLWTSRFSLPRIEVDTESRRNRDHSHRPSRQTPAAIAQLAQFLYNHNPFYIVGEFLVFSGLWQSFTQEAAWSRPASSPLGWPLTRCYWR